MSVGITPAYAYNAYNSSQKANTLSFDPHNRVCAQELGIVFHKIDFDSFEYINGTYFNRDALIQSNEIEGSFIRQINVSGHTNGACWLLFSSYYRSFFQISDTDTVNARMDAFWDNRCTHKYGGTTQYLTLKSLRNDRNDGFYTIPEAMERYVFLYEEINRVFGHDEDLSEQNIQALNNGFLQHMSYIFGFTGREMQLTGFDPALYASGQIAMSFIRAVADGMSLEDAKQTAIAHTIGELERMAEMYEEMSENQGANAQHWVNPNLNRTELTIDTVMSLARKATAVLTMVLSLKQLNSESE
jgi:hypothetical protein